METKPPLLLTYEEARLLLEAKGWGLTKAAEHLSKLPELEDDFDVSQATLSRKSSKGKRIPIESEVAAAIEKMETFRWYGRRTEIVEAGLRTIHGQPPKVDVHQLVLELLAHLPTNELAHKLADAVLEKVGPGSLLDTIAYAIADRLRATKLAHELVEQLNRFGGKHVAIAGGVGSVAACAVGLALFFALPSRSQAAPPGPLVLILANAGADGSPVRFEPGSLIAMAGLGEKVPPEQFVPVKTLPGQKVAPCDEGLGQEALNGNCWLAVRNVKPPCGRLFRSGDACYAPVAADSQKPVGSDANPAPAR